MGPIYESVPLFDAIAFQMTVLFALGHRQMHIPAPHKYYAHRPEQMVQIWLGKLPSLRFGWVNKDLVAHKRRTKAFDGG